VYIQELDWKKHENILEIIKICSDKDTYAKCEKDLKRNPFLLYIFEFLIINLFLEEKKLNKHLEKKRKLTPFEIEMEKRKKEFENLKKEEVSFLNTLIRFIRNNELDYSIVERITYTYYKNILEEHKEIRKSEEKQRQLGKAKDVSNIVNKI
jgi:hypothetical protein